MKREKTIVKTSFVGIVVNVLLTIFKAAVGFLSNSIAVLLDAVNNLSDALSSIITIFGIKLANKAPDRDHPYGHGRIEYFTSEIIGLIIFIAGCMALKESISKIINPPNTIHGLISITVIIVAILTKLFLARYFKNIGEHINSDTLVASGIDAYSDAILSIGTLAAALINIFSRINVEGYLGILISVLIFKNSVDILIRNSSALIGGRVNGELSKRIKKDISKFDQVWGVYDLILHSYGPNSVIGAVNIEVNENITAKDIHYLTRKINHDIFKKYGIFLTIGIYAANESDKDIKQIRNDLNRIIKTYKEISDIHAFYVDEELRIISFDLIIDFAHDRKQIKKEVISKMKEKYPDYNYHVILDSNYSD